MSTTQYQIFCRYYHVTSGKAVLNETEVEWVAAENRPEARQADKDTACVSYRTATQCEENLWIRHEDWLQVGTYYTGPNATQDRIRAIASMKKSARELDSRLSQIAIAEATIDNPKFDMIFVYDGIGSVEGGSPTNTTHAVSQQQSNQLDQASNPKPLVLYERFSRFNMRPWFVYATGTSLKWILKKAETLVKIIGKDNVIIGKNVDLAQYIEIV